MIWNFAASIRTLTPKALPVQIGEEFLLDGVISGAHYAGWGLLSVAILVLAGAF